MAMSTCVKCSGRFFEVKMFEPTGGNYKQNMVQCSACGTQVGVLDYYNVGAQTESLKKQFAEVSAQISRLQRQMDDVLNVLRQR